MSHLQKLSPILTQWRCSKHPEFHRCVLSACGHIDHSGRPISYKSYRSTRWCTSQTGSWTECWRFHHCVLPEYGCNARSWHPRLLPYGQKTLSWLFDLVYQSSNWQFRLYDQAAYVDILQTPHPIVLRYYPSSQLRQENHWGWMTSTQSLWRDHGRYDKDPRYRHSKFCRFYLRKVSKLTSKEGQGKYQKSPWLSYYPRGCWKQLHRLHFDVLLTSIALLQSRFARFCKFYHSSRWWICRPVCWRHNLSKAEYVHGES